jgi:hypothetical protein|tara:strand:+ start:80 stop:214 length:135 start_codon:yes stop_codon:yes gene_type:complete
MVVEYGHDQFLTILKDAQDIDPVQFKAEFQFNPSRNSATTSFGQ